MAQPTSLEMRLGCMDQATTRNVNMSDLFKELGATSKTRQEELMMALMVSMD
jgi:hypothetical protein